MIEIDNTSTMTEVGMTIRDEAIKYVQEGFDSKKWETWDDCEKLIEMQDGLDEQLVEGQEAFGFKECGDDDEMAMRAVQTTMGGGGGGGTARSMHALQKEQHI